MIKLYLPITIIIIIFSFLALTLATKYNLTQKLDFDLTVKIQDRMPERLLPYLSTFIAVGSWQVMSALVFCSMLLQRKKFWIIGILFILIAMIEIYGKYELQHPPPPQFMALRFQHLNVDRYHIRTEVASSYPSGHAARSAFLIFLWLPLVINSTTQYLQRRLNSSHTNFQIQLPFGFTLSKSSTPQFEFFDLIRILISVALIIMLVSFSLTIGLIKIYLGEHWSSDVLGGWLLGSSFGLIPFYYAKTSFLKVFHGTNILRNNHHPS